MFVNTMWRNGSPYNVDSVLRALLHTLISHTQSSWPAYGARIPLNTHSYHLRFRLLFRICKLDAAHRQWSR